MTLSQKTWFYFYAFYFLSIFFCFSEYQKIANPYLQIAFLDVGQGDATLIITPEKQKILIDTGPPGTSTIKLPAFLSFFDKTIDLLILTHPDQDHIGDTLNLIQNYQIQKVILPLSLKESKFFSTFLLNLENKKIPYFFAQNEADLQIGQTTFIDFIYPQTAQAVLSFNQLSNSSLIFKLISGKTHFLFSGDAEQKEEKLALLSGKNFRSDLFQAGHHGSKTSNSELFLQNIQPKIGILSVGQDNSFGHPHPEVLKNFSNYQSQVFQTNLLGNLLFSIHQNQIEKIF